MTNKKINDISHIDSINAEGTTYSIRLKFTKGFEINDDLALNKDKSTANFKKGNQVTQVLNVILKDIIRDEKYTEIGRNSKFFKTHDKSNIEIKDRDGSVTSVLEAYKGFTFGVTPCQNKLFLMVDYASRILRKETALEFMDKKNEIVGESVITDYNNYQIYKIDRVDTTKTPQSTFLYR